MKINPAIGNLTGIQKPAFTQRTQKANFGEFFNGVLKEVNQNQMDAKKITEDFVAGKDVELHEVMIAGEKAKTSLELLMEIRNKGIDMYKELTKIS